MATSLQKDALQSQLEKVLGISNVDFTTYNYKPTKPVKLALEALKDNIQSVSLRVLNYDYTDSPAERRVLLFTLEVAGDFSKLTKPQKRHLNDISASTTESDKFTLLVGSHHAGFEGLILSAEIIRHATKTGVAIKRTLQNCKRAVQMVKEALVSGIYPVLTQWTDAEMEYILREAGIALHLARNFEDIEPDDIYVALDSLDDDTLSIIVNGVATFNAKIQLTIVDGYVTGYERITYRGYQDSSPLYLFDTWLYLRNLNVNQLYQRALKDLQDKLENSQEKKQTDLDEILKQIAAVSTDAVAYANLKDTAMYNLDILVKRYIDLRETN